MVLGYTASDTEGAAITKGSLTCEQKRLLSAGSVCSMSGNCKRYRLMSQGQLEVSLPLRKAYFILAATTGNRRLKTKITS